MDQMRCAQCAAISYSAAARTLVLQGERCPQCGGELALTVQPPVGVAAERQRAGLRAGPDAVGRRFGTGG